MDDLYIVDMQFIHGYEQPTIAFLVEVNETFSVIVYYVMFTGTYWTITKDVCDFFKG